MEFHVYETGETIRARHRPVVIITSNNEKELPDADTLAAIVQSAFTRHQGQVADHGLDAVF